MRTMLLSFLTVPVLAGTCTAQISFEGFGDFEDINPYLFERDLHHAHQVIVDVYWGGSPDKKPAHHDQVRLDFLNDTAVAVRYERMISDTLLRLGDEWVSVYHLAAERRVHHEVLDSAGLRIHRRMQRLDDDVEVRWTRISQSDSAGTLTRTFWTRSDLTAGGDSTYHGNDGRYTNSFYQMALGKPRRIWASAGRTVEVIPGHRWRAFLTYAGDNSVWVWTYTLDKKGRLQRADRFAFTPEQGDASRDHVTIRYRE